MTGVANRWSIATGIAHKLHEHGAQIALTYQGERVKDEVQRLAAELGGGPVVECDVANDASLAAMRDTLARDFGKLDVLVHSIAFANKEDLAGKVFDTSRGGFALALDVSAYSLIALVDALRDSFNDGASIMALTYLGATQIVPNYNLMGIAKAALEATIRYVAFDLGDRGIRVNAISAGPIKTLAFAGIADSRYILKWNELNSPLKRNITQEEVGNAALYLLSDLGTGMTGEIMHVDGGYHVVGMIKTSSAKQIAELLGNFEGE